jgi:hypothetical protein
LQPPYIVLGGSGTVRKENGAARPREITIPTTYLRYLRYFKRTWRTSLMELEQEQGSLSY